MRTILSDLSSSGVESIRYADRLDSRVQNHRHSHIVGVGRDEYRAPHCEESFRAVGWQSVAMAVWTGVLLNVPKRTNNLCSGSAYVPGCAIAGQCG